MNDRIEQIEARSDYAMTHESLTASDYAEMAWESARDVPYLLALVREQQARLERVEAVRHIRHGLDDDTRFTNGYNEAINRIRAALTATQPETGS